jgi:hypothetical protein
VAKKSEQQQLEQWIISSDWNIFGTLKFQPIRMGNGHHAHNVVRDFWNHIDRVIYGSATKRGCRLHRWCFAHEGSHSDNYHVHFVAQSPIDADLFCCLSNTLWTKQDVSTASVQKNWITPVLDRERVVHYLTKEVWKLGSDSFDLSLSCNNALPFEINIDRQAAQQQRIARAITSNELNAAQAALNQHKADTERRLALRELKQSGKATCK